MKLDAQSPFGAPIDRARLLSAVFEHVSDVLRELPSVEPKDANGRSRPRVCGNGHGSKEAATDLFHHPRVEPAPEGWPKTAAALSGRLRTASPALPQVGLQVNIGGDGHGRWIRIKHRKVPD